MPTVPTSILRQDHGAFGAGLSGIQRRVGIIGTAADGPFLQAERVNGQQLKNIFKASEAVKAAAYIIGNERVDVMFCRMHEETQPSSAALNITQFTGDSGITLQGDPNGFYSIRIKWTTSGTVGTPGAAFQIATDGATYGPLTPLGTDNIIQISTTGLSIALQNGKTVEGLIAIEAHPGSPKVYGTKFTNDAGADASDAVISGTPVDRYNGRVRFIAGGTVGDPTNLIKYEVSLDGTTYAPARRLGPTAVDFEIMDYENVPSGLKVTLQDKKDIKTGAFIVFRTTAPQPSVSEIPQAVQALRDKGGSPVYDWEFIWLVRDSIRSDMGSLSSALNTIQADGPDQGFRWGIGHSRLHHENEQLTDWIDAEIVDFDPYVDTRISMQGGGCLLTCPMTGRRERRPASFPLVARILHDTEERDPGWRQSNTPPDGPLYADVSIVDANGTVVEYDARTNPALAEARFLTLTTYRSEPGIFCTRGNLMAAPGDPYNRIPLRRVENGISEILLQYGRKWLNSNFPGNATRPTISESAAQDFERNARAAVRPFLFKPRQKVTSFEPVVDRDNVMQGVTPVVLRVTYEFVALIYVDKVEAILRIVGTLNITR